MLKKRRVLLAKIETTYNTDPTPVANTDAILVTDPVWAPEGARMIGRTPAKPSLAPLKSVYAGSLKTVSFSAMLKGPGSAYSASNRPELDPLFRACGFGATIVTTPGSETATYVPVSTGFESCTLYLYTDGKRHILTGCRGTVNFSMETGGAVVANFTMTGHWTAPTDTALATPTYDTTSPPAFVGATFAVGGYAAVIGSLSIDMGTVLATPASANASDGFGEVQIVGRAAGGSMNPLDTLIATKNWISEWTANSSQALATGNIGSTQYNRFSFSLPAIVHKEISDDDVDGLDAAGVQFEAVESGTDDEVSLVFS